MQCHIIVLETTGTTYQGIRYERGNKIKGIEGKVETPQGSHPDGYIRCVEAKLLDIDFSESLSRPGGMEGPTFLSSLPGTGVLLLLLRCISTV